MSQRRNTASTSTPEDVSEEKKKKKRRVDPSTSTAGPSNQPLSVSLSDDEFDEKSLRKRNESRQKRLKDGSPPAQQRPSGKMAKLPKIVGPRNRIASGDKDVHSQPLSSQTSSTGSQTSHGSGTKRLNLVLDMMTKLNTVAEAVEADDSTMISDWIQDRMIQYYQEELAESEDFDGDDETESSEDPMCKKALADAISRMSKVALDADPGRKMMINSFSTSFVGRCMMKAFKQWLAFCSEEGHDYTLFDRDSTARYLEWLKNYRFLKMGVYVAYKGSSVEAMMVHTFSFLRMAGYLQANARLKDITGDIGSIAKRWISRNIGRDFQSSAQLSLTPDEIDRLCLRLPMKTPADVQGLVYKLFCSNFALRPSSLLQALDNGDPCQKGLLVRDISFMRDASKRLRMTVVIRFFKDVVNKHCAKSLSILERDSPFCLVKQTLLLLMLIGSVEFESDKFLTEGEIRVTPARPDLRLFNRTNQSGCILVGMPLMVDQIIWKRFAKRCRLPKNGINARSCRQGFINAAAISFVSDDKEATIQKLLEFSKGLNVWKTSAALNYLNKDIFWMADIQKIVRPNQPVSFQQLPARLAWPYVIRNIISPSEYVTEYSPSVREQVTGSQFYETVFKAEEQRLAKEEKTLHKPLESVVFAKCCRHLAEKTNRSTFSRNAAKIDISPLPEMPKEVLDVEEIWLKLKGLHVQNLHFLHPMGLSREKKECPVEAVCPLRMCSEKFSLSGDFDTHFRTHKKGYECLSVGCKSKGKFGLSAFLTHNRSTHYKPFLCVVCGKRAQRRICRHCRRTRDKDEKCSSVPLYIAQFLSLRKAADGDRVSLMDVVDKISLFDSAAGTSLASDPFLPVTAKPRRPDQQSGTSDGRKYEMYLKEVQDYNAELKILQFHREKLTAAENLMEPSTEEL